MLLNDKNLSEKSPDELLLVYREAAFEHGQATLNGDYRAGNRAFEIINNAYEEMKTRNIVEELLVELLSDENVNVKVSAASRLLPFNRELAEQVLREISVSDKSILGFNAQMVLKQWEKGELYPKS